MLNFWKKSGQKEKGEKARSNSTSPSKSCNIVTSPSAGAIVAGGDSHLIDSERVGPLTGFPEDELSSGDLGECDSSPTHANKLHTRSRLSKSLSEVLSDKSALTYFIQYLDAQRSVSLIKFWLDVESFRSASCARIRSDSTNGKIVCVPVTPEQLEPGDRTKYSPSPHHEEKRTLTAGYPFAGSHTIFDSPVRLGANVNPQELAENAYGDKLSSIPASSTSSTSGSLLSLPTFPSTSFPMTTDFESVVGNQYQEKMCNFRSESHSEGELASLEVNSGLSDCAKQSFSQSVKAVSEPPSDKTSLVSVTDELLSPSRANKLIQATLNDAVKIYKKYIATDAVHHIVIPEEIKQRLIDAICREDGLVDSESFTEFQLYVFHIMEKDFFNDFLRSDFYCKHQIDVLTSGSVLLSDILYNETALFYFMEYMEQEGSRSLVEFFIAAENFQQHLMAKKGNYDATEAQNDAIVLYDKYFSLQATCPLGFNDKIRFEVEHNICREEGPLPDCFKRPLNVVLQFMEKNYLHSFLTSQLYFKYLTELINTIQASPGLHMRNRKSGSESSSELNISLQNTLLAMEDINTPPKKIIRNIDEREMSIDSRQLYDPDSLWRRRHQSDLSFGRVTKMGRFETDVEPEPDKKEESRITRVVRKLVNMEEDKAKEEMAWQIAEMIVKDITNLTIGSEDESES